MHAKYDARATTAAAREASRTKRERDFLAEIDPDGLLNDLERERRLAFRRKQHFAQLQRKSVQARRNGKASTTRKRQGGRDA